MERIYRLEFNEKQQQFHLDNNTHVPNTNGWVTICENISDLEFKIFGIFLDCISKTNDYTLEDVLKASTDSMFFMNALTDDGLCITKESVTSTLHPPEWN